MTNPTVSFMGYNSTGIDKQKCMWINELCELTNIDYLSIQEHFKISKNTDQYFNDKFSKFNCYVIPGRRIIESILFGTQPVRTAVPK